MGSEIGTKRRGSGLGLTPILSIRRRTQWIDFCHVLDVTFFSLFCFKDNSVQR